MSKKSILALLSAGALGVLALLGGAVYFLGSTEFEDLASDYAIRTIGSRTGMAVSLESFEADFWGQTFTLNGLELRGGESADDPPFLMIPRVLIGFRLRALLSRRIDLWSLEIDQPKMFLRVAEGGRTNIPSPPLRDRDRGRLPVEVVIGDFVLSEGSLTINESRVDVDFGLSDVQGLFDWAEGARVLSGSFGYTGAIDGVGTQSIPYSLQTDFEYAGGTVNLRPAVVTSGETRLDFEGQIADALGARTGTLEYDGIVDVPFLNYFLPDARLSGTSAVAGSLSFSTREIEITGHARAESLEVDGWVATDLESDFNYLFPERVVEATNLRTGFAGGEAFGRVAFDPLPGSPVIKLDLTYEQIDPVYFGELIPWGVDHTRNSLADGTVQGWLVGGFEDFELSGEIELKERPGPEAGPSPETLTGSTLYRARPGSIELTDGTALLGATRAAADGLISAEALALDVFVESNDLRDLAFVYPGANGSGSFTGSVSGSMDRPELQGEFWLAGSTYRDRTVERIGGGIALAGDEVEFTDVVLVDGASELRIDGSYNILRGEPDLNIEIVRLEAGELAQFGLPRFEGMVSGDVLLTSMDPIDAEGSVEVADLEFGDYRLGNGSADFRYAADSIALSGFRFAGDGTMIAGDARYDRARDDIEADVLFAGQRLEQFHDVGVPTLVRGRVRDAEFRVTGSTDLPNVEGAVALEEFALGRQAFPEARIVVRTDGGLLRGSVGTDERLDLDFEVDLSQDAYPLSGTVEFVDFDAGELAGLDAGSIIAVGRAGFTSPLSDLSLLSGAGRVATLIASIGEETLEVTRPFDFAFTTREVSVAPVELIGGEGTSVELEGTIAIAPAAPLDLYLYGPVDLSLLGNRYEGLDAGGTVTVDAEITGTVVDPELNGVATLLGVSVQHESLFLGLSGLTGDIFLDGPRLTLGDVRGVMGGGVVVLGGEVALGGEAGDVIDIRADAANVRVRTLSGLRAIMEGAFGIRGALDALVLEGNVQLLSLSFDEDFNEFLSLFDRGPDTGDGDGPLDTMTLAVHVEGDRNIRVENELADIESRVDLDIGGTLGRPTLTGHTEVTRGTVTLQGRRYRITRGNVDFVDPVGIDPRIDIQAEADIRDYRVILLITGQGDDIQVTMRSDPSLPQLEIVSLIAGGRTREELADTGALGAVSEEQLFQGAASTILADMLQSRVGSRLGVLNSIRIDPFLVGAENDPVARLTISEQITSDLEITYSQDLSSNSQQIIQIEYFLDGDTSFIASRDEFGRLGLDVKLRKRFD